MMACKEIQHRIDPRWPQPRRRRHQMDADRRRPPVHQQFFQFTSGQRLPDDEVGQTGNADAGTQGWQHRLAAVDGQAGAYLHHDILLARP